MKQYLIRTWHGKMPERLEETLNKIAIKKDGFWVYNGSLDDFQNIWRRVFMVFEEDIYVTHYNNFNPR